MNLNFPSNSQRHECNDKLRRKATKNPGTEMSIPWLENEFRQSDRDKEFMIQREFVETIGRVLDGSS